MEISILNRFGTTSKAMKQYAEKKLRMANLGIREMKVTIESEYDGIRVSARYVDKGNHHYVRSVLREDYYEAVDLLKDVIFASVTGRCKDRPEPEFLPEDYLEYAELVKEKVLVASPMSLEQAIDEMASLGHDWYIYRDDDNNIAVLYRRYDGDLGKMVVK